MLKDIVQFYGLVDATAQGVTARDRAKDLPIRILHGGRRPRGVARGTGTAGIASGAAARCATRGGAASVPARGLRVRTAQQHDAAWLRGVEDHVRRAEALRPGTRAVARPQAAAATAEREAWLRRKVEASVFARCLQDIEDGCLGCVRRVLQAEGWPARSWQQDGLLVENEGCRRLRGGGGGNAVARLERHASGLSTVSVIAREAAALQVHL
jgi:hypothetical protein